MIRFRRQPKPLAGHAAARRNIADCRSSMANMTKAKLVELSTAIDNNSGDLPELLADAFPFAQTMSEAIRQLDMLLAEPPKAAPSKRRSYTLSSRIAIDAWQFLKGCKDGNERLLLATGIETCAGNVVISELIHVRMQEQSASYVQAHPGDLVALTDRLDSSGHKLWLMAHSHIMSGKASTRPSGTDIAHQQRMANYGLPDMLGCIVSLDGWMRVFSTAKAFDLHVYGNGVTVTDDSPREKILKIQIDREPDHVPQTA